MSEGEMDSLFHGHPVDISIKCRFCIWPQLDDFEVELVFMLYKTFSEFFFQGWEIWKAAHELGNHVIVFLVIHRESVI